MTNVSFEKDMLKIGKNSICLTSPIEKVVEVGDVVLVLLKDKSSKEPRKKGNICAFDHQGRQLWVVEPPRPFEGWYRPFTGLYLRDGSPIAYSPIGIEYRIDADTGKLIDIPGQRPW